MISVVTPVYRTPAEILARTYASLRAQTHSDWEWVIWDDSGDDLAWRQIYGFAADSRYKIRAHRSLSRSGSIGQVKRQAFMVAEGDILVELDHDDELTPDCLETLEDSFSRPEVGFAYSDWCEVFADGSSGKYPPGWAFGYGSEYWDEAYGVWVMRAPEINSTTIRHIVSAPNHVRAWRADVYRALGGHDPGLPVADDFDLVVRTFLETEIERIPRLLYKQHIGPHTAQRQRNAQIQTLVKEIAERYDDSISRRFADLEDNASSI